MSLTRGGVGILGLIAFVLILSTPNNATTFIVLSCFASLLILNFPYAFLAVRKLAIYRDHPSHVKEDSEIRVILRVVNQARGPRILLRLFDRGPGQGKVDPVQIPLLPGRGVESASYTCRAGKRGIYRFSNCAVESSSPFGLINARRNLRAESDLVIYPLYYELMGAMFPFRKSFSGLTAMPGSRPGEGASFFGLREYREGDPIRKIHWPSSVRTRTLMVKEFEEDLHSSIVILLDTDRRAIVSDGSDNNLEAAIRTAASLGNYTLVNGHPTTLVYFDESAKSLRTDKAASDLTPILDSLARLGASTMNPAELIASARVLIPKQANLITVLLSADRNAMEELLKLRAQGVEIMLVIADREGVRFRESERPWLVRMLEMYEAAGINTIMIALGDDIQAMLSKNMRASRRVRV